MESFDIAFKTATAGYAGKNEDSFLCRDNLFIVVDGAGGEYWGEMERARACQVIYKFFFSKLREVHSLNNALIFALEEANKEILKEKIKIGQKQALSVCVVYISDNIMYFAHMGDSRVYCLHGKEIFQLTRDHTLSHGEPFFQTRSHDPHLMRTLTNALGIHETPEIKVKTFILHERDLILITTNGLTSYVSNKEILKFSLKTKKLETLCNRFIDIVSDRGGRNIITSGLIRFEKKPGGQQKRIIAYSVVTLLILSVIGSYALKYSLNGSQDDQIKDLQSSQEKSEKKKYLKSDDKKSPPSENQTIDLQPVQKRSEQQGVSSVYDELHEFLIKWKTAWENSAGKRGDIEGYISFYSDDFLSKGLDKNGWRRDKGNKNRKKRWIHVELKDIRISELKTGNRIEARFLQEYKSSNFSVRTKKLLILDKDKTGWEIISEKTY